MTGDEQVLERIENWIKASLKQKKNLVPLYDVFWMLKYIKKLHKEITENDDNRHL
jgi:hypothetical protein